MWLCSTGLEEAVVAFGGLAGMPTEMALLWWDLFAVLQPAQEVQSERPQILSGSFIYTLKILEITATNHDHEILISNHRCAFSHRLLQNGYFVMDTHVPGTWVISMIIEGLVHWESLCLDICKVVCSSYGKTFKT